MFGLRMPELLLILLIVVILFGANKLPQIGAGLGQSIRGFKKALDGQDDKQDSPPAPGASDQTPPKH
jgi:sec-independent protein translocase protein TatA